MTCALSHNFTESLRQISSQIIDSDMTNC